MPQRPAGRARHLRQVDAESGAERRTRLGAYRAAKVQKDAGAIQREEPASVAAALAEARHRRGAARDGDGRDAQHVAQHVAVFLTPSFDLAAVHVEHDGKPQQQHERHN